MNPHVDYGPMGSFPPLLRPSAYMARRDLMDCFLHWLASHGDRRLLEVRRFGFRLGPIPGTE